MQSNRTAILIGIVVSVILLIGTFSGGVIVGYLLPGNRQPDGNLPSIGSLIPPEGPEASTPSDQKELFKPFWEAWDIVHDNFVDQPLDDELLMQGAIRGMVDALGDQHTSYMDPDQTRELNTSLEGEYEGIGAEVDPTTDYLTIVSPFPNSPAEEAGLRPGDQVIAVDGEDMIGIDGHLVVRKVLGPAGTKVVLTILREGNLEPFDVEITRATIVLPTLESRMLEGNIAYIRLYGFGEKSAADLRKALEELLSQEPAGLIFDLRSNGGGLLSAAVDVSSEFLEDKVVVIQEFGDGTRETLSTNSRGVATEIPLVVLVNEGSASASEIVAGAIQDYGRGRLVGMTTFGKGSVQLPIELQDDQGIVRVTIARWLTPNERQIHEVGLEPDVEVELTNEDFDAGRDPQLDKAVELLSTP